MDSGTKYFIIIGAASAALAIGLGAFGAHALRASLSPRMLEIYHTAVFYHLVHSLGLLAVAFVCALKPGSRTAKAAGGLMCSGVILFSGSLYLLAVTGANWLGAITPLGGAAMMAAWLLLVASVLRS